MGTTTQDDLYGRLWLLVEVDLAAAAHKIEDYDESVRELFGEEEVDRSAGIEYPDSDGDGDVCEHGHWITAVHGGAQYNALLDSGHSYGAKARSIRDWVISHL